VLALPPRNLPEPVNLIQRRGALSDFALLDLGLEGNQRHQTTRRRDGQGAFAVYLRGEIRRVRVERCRIAGFGEAAVRPGETSTGGGGIVLGPAPDDTAQALEDVVVRDCVFAGNGNVPGVYVAAGGRPGARRRDVRIVGNRFAGVPAGTRPQNCVYVLADGPDTRIEGVRIADNLFDVDTYVDACMELNWVDGFAITGNVVTLTGAVDHTSGLLLRDGCRAGAVTGNVFVDASGHGRTVAVALVNFAHPGTIEDVVLTGNVVRGFRWRGIAIDRGSRGIVVASNRIAGGAAPTGEALRIADAADVAVTGNAVEDAVHGVRIAVGDTPASALRDVRIVGNRFRGCGGAGAVVEGETAPLDVEGLVVRDNAATAPRPGTDAFVGLRPRMPDGNVVAGNDHPGLPAVRPGTEDAFALVRPGP
jgi:hypothetical protein